MPTPAAIRMRRLRARRNQGCQQVRVNLDSDTIDRLREREFLTEGDLSDPERLANRLGEIIDEFAEDVTS